MDRMPVWADVVLIPLISLLLAAALSAVAIWAIGENPWDAFSLMVDGALMRSSGWGYTLYYATNFIFCGLAVSVAFHAKLFNIGGEGQAVIGSLGVALCCLYIPWPHWTIALLGSTVFAALFGALWALIPAYLQAARGSHIVITTIMFNFIAAALLNYVLVNHLRPVGAMEPASATFPAATHLPDFRDIFAGGEGVLFRGSPANVTFFVALAACVLVWLLIWRTKLGYEIRSQGYSESGAKYAGISPFRIIIVAMLISGGLAGLMGINVTQGEAERLILNSAEGAGFIGIAVALMGRNHPFGVLLASILFGFLYQGAPNWRCGPRSRAN